MKNKLRAILTMLLLFVTLTACQQKEPTALADPPTGQVETLPDAKGPAA